MEIKDGALTTTVSDEVLVMSEAEWIAEGKSRFGEDFSKWRFVCPVCKHVASGQNFKDAGAKPRAMYQECIGRYSASTERAFGDHIPKGPCDYALYGLFRLPGVIVETQDGHKIMAFAFADGSNVNAD
jgi:hypothetical protein